jgi:N-acetylneuraminate synthase
MNIAGREIGPKEPPFVIAEMSGNHGGTLERALAVVNAAADCGADAIKFQTYTPDTITLKNIDPRFTADATGPWAGQTLYDLYEEAHTPWEWQPALFAEARRRSIIPFSSAFDATAVDFLETLDCPAYKVASFEMIDLPLIERIARTGKPIIISTGMAKWREIAEAIDAAHGAASIAILKCTSDYPARPADMHLATIPDLVASFDLPVGISDHSLGIAVPVAAVTLGACIVEKHFCLGRCGACESDYSFSLEPKEFTEMVKAVRTAWEAIGRVHYGPTKHERENYRCRRGLFVVRNVAAGEPFTEANVRSLRPGYGIKPKYLPRVLAARASRDLHAGLPLEWEMIAE